MIRFMSAAAIALSVTAAPILVAAPAAAQGLQLEVGPNGVRPVVPYGYDGPRSDGPRYEERRGGCSPREARRAAREEGLRDAQVVRVSDRSIVVEGFTRRGPERIRFANAPGCPTLG
ncbi:hypothetical protein MKI84_07425 [Ancylobacter sp. A5.8]|uniref:hypothetical protein n=1 Tax=Ancylobacter gelatini TaxID=2919920 RepID=UPI001F4E1CEF|nr:hypothetical protein [Ancylobacter gelatini]MCJ8142745.1 hypothetical protein [Ancylobacter gelatini]